jgi:hypothetical protein
MGVVEQLGDLVLGEKMEDLKEENPIKKTKKTNQYNVEWSFRCFDKSTVEFLNNEFHKGVSKNKILNKYVRLGIMKESETKIENMKEMIEEITGDSVRKNLGVTKKILSAYEDAFAEITTSLTISEYMATTLFNVELMKMEKAEIDINDYREMNYSMLSKDLLELRTQLLKQKKESIAGELKTLGIDKMGNEVSDEASELEKICNLRENFSTLRKLLHFYENVFADINTSIIFISSMISSLYNVEEGRLNKEVISTESFRGLLYAHLPLIFDELSKKLEMEHKELLKLAIEKKMKEN